MVVTHRLRTTGLDTHKTRFLHVIFLRVIGTQEEDRLGAQSQWLLPSCFSPVRESNHSRELSPEGSPFIQHPCQSSVQMSLSPVTHHLECKGHGMNDGSLSSRDFHSKAGAYW